MGKGKPRHFPDKPQNKTGNKCCFYENNVGATNEACCVLGYDVTKCKGNPHNHKKVEYQKIASN